LIGLGHPVQPEIRTIRLLNKLMPSIAEVAVYSAFAAGTGDLPKAYQAFKKAMQKVASTSPKWAPAVQAANNSIKLVCTANGGNDQPVADRLRLLAEAVEKGRDDEVQAAVLALNCASQQYCQAQLHSIRQTSLTDPGQLARRQALQAMSQELASELLQLPNSKHCGQSRMSNLVIEGEQSFSPRQIHSQLRHFQQLSATQHMAEPARFLRNRFLKGQDALTIDQNTDARTLQSSCKGLPMHHPCAGLSWTVCGPMPSAAPLVAPMPQPTPVALERRHLRKKAGSCFCP